MKTGLSIFLAVAISFGAVLLYAGQSTSCGVTNISVPQTSFLLGGGGDNAQTLAVSPATVQAPSPGHQYVTEGEYRLKFTVLNQFASYPGFYDVEVRYGTQQLCEVYGWATRVPVDITLTCPANGYLVIDQAMPGGGPVQGAQPFVLDFSVAGPSTGYDAWGVAFSNVSFTFTPDAP